MHASSASTLLPAAEAPGDYRREGFAIRPEVLPAPLVAELRTHLDGLMANLTEGQRPEDLVEPHVKAADWRFWLEICRHPLILAEVAEAMGANELLLIMSHLIVKPPFDGKRVAWHQDITYWSSVQGTDVSTVWLAIDDVDPGNACMHVIPQTHADRERMEKLATDGTDLLKVRVRVTPEQESSAVPCTLHAGGLSIHDSFAIHGSAANTSPRRRAGYTMRYADARTTTVDTAQHWVPVYYVHGDGAGLRPGMIDLRPGKPLPATPGNGG